MKKIITFLLLCVTLFTVSACNKTPKEETINDVYISATVAKNLKTDKTVYIDSVYNQKEDVALYLVAFKKMPSNYYERDEFSKLASKFTQENLISCYGGKFSNREKILPLNDSYHELDINYRGGGRGAERIVFNNNYSIVYYTSDHYKSFVRVYNENYIYDNVTMFN